MSTLPETDADAEPWPHDVPESADASPTAVSVARSLLGLGGAMRVGRFMLLEECGQGAMGVVYTAWDPRLERRVAIKVLKKRGADVDRVLREARAAAKLNHPNVVTVFDAGEDGTRSYVAMEFIEGQSLDHWLHKAKPDEFALRDVFAQLARGLHAAHEANLVHRDFKPGNVLISRQDGKVLAQVLDFGLTISVGDDNVQVGGTPSYMPPEQRIGEPATPHGDQYSFFVTLYEALAGERPRKRPAPLEKIPRGLRGLVARGLSEEPGERNASMAEVAQALSPTRRSSRRWVVAGLGLACVGGLSFWSANADAQPCQQAVERWQVAAPMAELEAQTADVETATSQRLLASFENYGERWAAVQTEVCEATFVHGSQSQQRLDARMECLEGQLANASAVAQAVLEQPARAVKALGVVAAWPPPAECKRAEVPSPTPPSAERRRKLAKVRTHIAFLEWQPALAEVASIPPRAEAAGSIGQEVNRLVLHSITLERSGQLEEAADLLDEALAGALEAQLPQQAAEIAHEKIWQEGLRKRDLGAARTWEKLGRSWLRAAHLDDTLRAAGLLDRLAATATVARDVPLATQLHEEALESVATVYGEDAAATISLRVHLHTVLPRDSARARRLRTETLQLIDQHYGPEHPMAAVLLAGGGVVYEEPGACDRALPDFKRALEIKTRHYGEDAIDLIPVLNSIANCQGTAGRHSEAADTLRRSLGIIETTLGPEHPRASVTLYNLAIGELAAEEYAEAAVHAQRAYALDEASLGKDHPSLAGHRLVMGQAALGQGEIQRALVEFDRSLALEDPATRYAMDRVETRQFKAKALVAAGRVTEAREMLQEALAIADAAERKDDVSALRRELADLDRRLGAD